MSMKNIKQKAEDQYLDLIIRLAYEQKADQEVEQLLNEPDYELTTEEKDTADKAFQDVLSEEDTRRKHEKRRQSTKNFRHMLVKVCEVAACLIIIIGIVFPIAIATSAQFRSKVMQLLMDLDEVNDEAHFRFTEDESASFYVPEQWTGEWFMSFIPDDLSLVNIQVPLLFAEYSDGGNRQLWFNEMSQYDDLMVGTENANIRKVMVNGSIGWMLAYQADDLGVVIIWNRDDKWFQLNSFYLSETEMLQIAEGVKKIQQ